MTDILFAFLLGAGLSAIGVLCIVGAARQNRELDIYMEGFNDGQNALKHINEYGVAVLPLD